MINLELTNAVLGQYTEGAFFELKTSLRGTKQKNEELKGASIYVRVLIFKAQLGFQVAILNVV